MSSSLLKSEGTIIGSTLHLASATACGTRCWLCYNEGDGGYGGGLLRAGYEPRRDRGGFSCFADASWVAGLRRFSLRPRLV